MELTEKPRLTVKRILRKYKYPPDLPVDLLLLQAHALGDAWVA